MMLSRKQEWILRVCLVSFGVLIASALGGVTYILIRRHQASEKGIEFKNLHELRASLASADKKNHGAITLGTLIEPHQDDQIIYDLRPGLNLKFQGADVQTNSCGMRERELPLLKPAGTYRIAIIGDSFTFGWGVQEEEAFPRQLEEILNQVLRREPQKRKVGTASKFSRVEVLNFGVPGYSPFQEVATFKEKALAYDPDAVILFFIENDFGMPFFIRDLEQPQKLSAATTVTNLARAALLEDPDATDLRVPKLAKQFDPNRALNTLTQIAEENGVKVFLAINPKKNWQSIHEKLWVLKHNHEIRFMNFYEEFNRIIKTRGYTKESLTLPNDQHPSARKHRMLAEVMAPYFLNTL